MERDSFVPGQIPVYEKYSFIKKRTMFGLIKIVFIFVRLFGESDSSDYIEKKDSWHKVNTEVKIHKDCLILITQKRLLILWWYLKYGKNMEKIRIEDIESIRIEKNGSPKLVISCKAGNVIIPAGKGTKREDVQHFLRNMRVANPKIAILGN